MSQLHWWSRQSPDLIDQIMHLPCDPADDDQQGLVMELVLVIPWSFTCLYNSLVSDIVKSKSHCQLMPSCTQADDDDHLFEVLIDPAWGWLMMN